MIYGKVEAQALQRATKTPFRIPLQKTVIIVKTVGKQGPAIKQPLNYLHKEA